MHFQVHVTVRSRHPIEVGPPFPINGFSLLLGVNASDAAAAATFAHGHAFAPTNSLAEQVVADGFVEELRIEAIERNSWPEVTRQLASNIDSPGVYFATEPAFRAAQKQEPAHRA